MTPHEGGDRVPASAYLTAIARALPEAIVTNADLQAENPDWDLSRIGGKTGIAARHIAGPDETASDLGFQAASRLFEAMPEARATVDYLLFCSQSPDYVLPTTACLLQDRLGLSTDCGALDFNQGCSGYVYGLNLAQALIVSGQARSVLLITAETYSKLIHPRDRSVRVLFGDAATASLITGEPGGARIGATVLGTDGSGARHLMVPAGGGRQPSCAATKAETTDEHGMTRTLEHLYMDGQELFLFTLKRIPELVSATLARARLSADDVRWFVFHQANAFMNTHLRTKLHIPAERAPMYLETVGNTVSNTIPLTLHHAGGDFQPGHRVMCVGFGVGYSWGACVLDWDTVRMV
ncbi:MAG: 3-oxoacyl-ACP synthase [Gemmatimonadetes bacterium]|jgi:3-oxoacyl-[acyl-carrier-protein] synthase-3|nr:3-oxoacyl-ACP synthase [Gemmatimonadota bacterium]